VGRVPSPIPIHILRPAGRQPSLKATLFIEKAAGELRKRLGGHVA
jgi:hypothetical protein